MREYNVIIPVYWGNYEMIEWNIPFIRKNLGARKVVLIGPKSMGEQLPEMKGVEYIDGNTILEGLSKESLAKIIDDVCEKNGIPKGNRAGWYLQQFIKLGYATRCEDDYYVTWDMDTLPLNKIQFFDKDGKGYFFPSKENHTEYMDTLNTLLPGVFHKYSSDYSFVNSFTVFHTQTVKEIIGKVEGSSCEGNYWWEKCMYAIAPNEINQSGFAEGEIFGNYAMEYHPELFSIRWMKQSRRSAKFISLRPNEKQLAWAAKSYDVITLEPWNYKSDRWVRFCNHVRGIISLKRVTQIYEFSCRVRNKLRCK